MPGPNNEAGEPVDAKTEATNIANAPPEAAQNAAADAYKADTAGNTPEGQKYWTDVATNLQAAGKLPAVGFVEGGGLAGADTAEAQKGLLNATSRYAQSPIERATAADLLKPENFEYLDAASEGNGINADSFKNVNDLKDKKQEQQSNVAMLTGSKDGTAEGSLLGRIDKDAKGEEGRDGAGDFKVSQKDIQEALSANPDAYSENEKRFLNDMAAQSNEDWEKNPLVGKDEEGKFRINKDSLLHANDYAGLATKLGEVKGKDSEEQFNNLVGINKQGAHFNEGDPEHPSYVISGDGSRRDFQYGANHEVVGVTEYTKNFEDGRASEQTNKFSMNAEGKWGLTDPKTGEFRLDGTSGHSVDKDGNYQVFQDLSGDPAMKDKPAEQAHVLRSFDPETGAETVKTGVAPWTPPPPAPPEGEQK